MSISWDKAHRRVLLAMCGAALLKSHRDLDGNKVYKLHLLDGREEIVAWKVVEELTARGFIDSNKKFPAATYWLTDRGKAALMQRGH